jgi:hypothetical protein
MKINLIIIKISLFPFPNHDQLLENACLEDRNAFFLPKCSGILMKKRIIEGNWLSEKIFLTQGELEKPL